MKNKIYGYARVSTPKQNIERQVRNILNYNSEAHIVKEVYTGGYLERKELAKILKVIQPNDTIIFDSVSRMSREAAEGFELYEQLFNKKVNLVFLKEPHINTETYRRALDNRIHIKDADMKTQALLQGINAFLMELAKEQIKIAFEQAQKELQDLHQRTKEGIETARLNGKQIGRPPGSYHNTKKALKRKADIKKYNKSFGGTLNNEETWKLLGISKMTFYKYKKELLKENYLSDNSQLESSHCV